MCRRYSQKTSAKEIAAAFDAVVADEFEPKQAYNPKALVPVVVHSEKHQQREVLLFRWGLVPHWAKEEAIGNKLYNARSETLHEKPSFRDSFVKRRCIIPATHFYEWNAEQKTLYTITHATTPIMAFAGLWDRWKNLAGELILSCTIVTTEASPIIAPVHHRMPVILNTQGVAQWLDQAQNNIALAILLKPSEDIVVNK